MNTNKKITYTGMMMALVFVATAIIPHIPTPRGYVNFGDGIIFIASILFGWQIGALVGGVGSALADLFLGYSQWALPTFIIKGLMGAVVGIMANPINKKVNNIIIGLLVAGWVTFNTYAYKLLTSVGNSKELAKQLELDNLDSLNSIISNMQATLIIAASIIPIIIVMLSLIFNKKDTQLFSINTIIGIILGGLIMSTGYYTAEAIIYGNKIVPIFELPLNFLQFGLGVIVAYVVIIPLRKSGILRGMEDK